MKKLFATAVVLASAAMAQAGTYSVYGVVSAGYTPDFLGSVSTDVSVNTGAAAVYQVDLYVTYANGGASERGFGNVVYDVNFAGDSLGAITVPGWNPTDATADSNGALPGGSVALFATNADSGASTTDLQNILTSIAVIPSPVATDARAKVGEGAGTFLGSVFVDWDGTGLETLDITVKQASYASTSGGVLVTDAGATLVDSSITFGVVPEPASLGLLGVAGLGLLRRRRA